MAEYSRLFIRQADEFMQRIVEQLDGGASKTYSLQLCILKRFVEIVNVKENKKYYCNTYVSTSVSNGFLRISIMLKLKPIYINLDFNLINHEFRDIIGAVE